MKYQYSDGGREAAGFRGTPPRDCVCRSVAIASGRPYMEVYSALAAGAGSERRSLGATARNGIHTSRKWFRDLMESWGFVWVPTMRVGSGCQVHLRDGELPGGRLVVSVSKHYTAVVDGVIHDTADLQRYGRRCVYGYWVMERGVS